MSTTLAFSKGLGKKRCFVAIFLCFFTVFLIHFIGLFVVIERTVGYISYNIIERADTISYDQFDNDKQDYDVNFVSYDCYEPV